MGGYMCHGSKIDLRRVEHFITQIGACEDVIFNKRMREMRRQKVRRAGGQAGWWTVVSSRVLVPTCVQWS